VPAERQSPAAAWGVAQERPLLGGGSGGWDLLRRWQGHRSDPSAEPPATPSPPPPPPPRPPPPPAACGRRKPRSLLAPLRPAAGAPPPARRSLSGGEGKKLPGGEITAAQVHQIAAARHLPPCMALMYERLSAEHHLKHYGLQQMSLFLKHIGLPLEQALMFWRSMFSPRQGLGGSGGRAGGAQGEGGAALHAAQRSRHSGLWAPGNPECYRGTARVTPQRCLRQCVSSSQRQVKAASNPQFPTACSRSFAP
jgi:hypothetical protein